MNFYDLKVFHIKDTPISAPSIVLDGHVQSNIEKYVPCQVPKTEQDIRKHSNCLFYFLILTIYLNIHFLVALNVLNTD